ncbi:MAG: hypothetical protein ACOX7I_08920 [Oscillospiraceae bacterium]|jgi:hypothetical protein
MFFVEGFFELFETVLAYVSNTVSFLRVGAFAISHAGMMMVVFLLAETANGGSNIIAVIIGNIIVMGIEAVLVCIQVMRLHFYEMFGRFYTGAFSLGGLRVTCKAQGRRVDASFDTALEELIGHFSELTGIKVDN